MQHLDKAKKGLHKKSNAKRKWFICFSSANPFAYVAVNLTWRKAFGYSKAIGSGYLEK